MGRGNRANAGLFSRREESPKHSTVASIGSIEGSRYAYRIRVTKPSGQLVTYHQIDEKESKNKELVKNEKRQNHQVDLVVVEETIDDALVWREIGPAVRNMETGLTSYYNKLEPMLKDLKGLTDLPQAERTVLDDGRVLIEKVQAEFLTGYFMVDPAERNVLDSQVFDPADPDQAKEAVAYYAEIQEATAQEQVRRQEMLEKRKAQESDSSSIKQKRLQALEAMEEDIDSIAIEERAAQIKAEKARQELAQAERDLEEVARQKEKESKSRAKRTSRWSETASGIGRL
jgi:hypothetical protein